MPTSVSVRMLIRAGGMEWKAQETFMVAEDTFDITGLDDQLKRAVKAMTNGFRTHTGTTDWTPPPDEEDVVPTTPPPVR